MTAPSRERRGLAGLLLATGTSGLGTRMTFLALPWLVLSTTGSPVQTGLVAAAEMTPYVLVQGLGGPLVDRLGAWRTSICTDIAAESALGLVPVIAVSGPVPLALLAALVAVVGALRGAGDAARDVLLPGVVELAGTPMERAAVLFDGASRTASLVGAPMAGILISVSSPLTVLAADAGTFAASAILVLRLVPSSAQPPTRAEVTHPESSYLHSLAAGFRYLRGDRLLLGIAVMVMITNLLDQAGGGVLVPLWAKDIAGSPVALGGLGAAFSAGAVTGNVVATWLAPKLPRRATYAVGFLLAGGPRYLGLALAGSVSPVLPLFIIGGIGVAGINPILGAVEYERVPRHLQARVLGALGATAWAGIPVGTLAGGVAADAFGVRAALLLAGCLYLFTTLAPFVFPSWRGMDRAAEPELVGANR